MAVNTSRSMNVELEQGRLDGVIKQAVRDRGGEVDAATFNARDTLANSYYGVGSHEELDSVALRYQHGDEYLPL